jgi:AcrR family transcriptional regulator
LFDAALLGLGERGFDDLVIADVLVQAEVSPAAFEAEFKDLDSCLFAAYDDLTERLAKRVTSRCRTGEDWPLRVHAGLEALLEELAAQPEMALVLTRSFPALRPLARLRYTEFLESFAPFLRQGRDFSDPSDEPPGELEMLAIGAAEAVILTEIDAGRAADLSSHVASILFSLLVPFLGPERSMAISEAGRA